MVGEEDDEAPEDQCMHEAGAEALQQLALADDHDRLGTRARGHVVESRRGLAGPDDSEEQKRATREQADRDQDRQRQRDQAQRDFRISAEIAGTISFKSPTTA